MAECFLDYGQTLIKYFRFSAIRIENPEGAVRVLGVHRAKQNAIGADTVIAVTNPLNLMGRGHGFYIRGIENDAIIAESVVFAEWIRGRHH